MEKEIVTQVQETQRVPNRINPRQNTTRHILIKLTKIKHKEQIVKAAREKQQITHKGILIKITADLSIETLQARRDWQDILKVMKENNLQPRLLYPERISFRYEEFKSFTDKQKAERIQHHQTSSSTNAKGSSLGNTERLYEREPKTTNQMAMGLFLSIITLNVNGLNAPIKDKDWLNGYKSKTLIYAVYQRPTSKLGTHTD